MSSGRGRARHRVRTLGILRAHTKAQMYSIPALGIA